MVSTRFVLVITVWSYQCLPNFPMNPCIGANKPSRHQLLFSLLFSIDNYTTPNFCHRHHNVLPLYLGDSRDTSLLTMHSLALALTLNLLHPHLISCTQTCAHSCDAHSLHEWAHSHWAWVHTLNLPCHTCAHASTHLFATARTSVLNVSHVSFHSHQMSTICCLWVGRNNPTLMLDTGSCIWSDLSYLVRTFTLIHDFSHTSVWSMACISPRYRTQCGAA